MVDKMIVDVTPMGAVRMTRRGKWVSEKAQRYLTYKDSIGYQLNAQWNREPTIAACSVKITFYMPIPPSWSKLKQQRMKGQPHDKKPDIDNLIKGLFDASNGIVWKDDNRVVRLKDVEKIYSFKPRIELEVEELF